MSNKKITPFDELLGEIKRNQELLEKGNKTFLTLKPIFPRFSNVLPGFIKSDLITITGGTGHSKSKFTWFLCNNFLKYKDFDVHVLFNGLEETTIKIASGFILNYLSKRGYKLSFYELLNYKNKPHSKEVIKLIEEAVILFNKELHPRLKIYQKTVPSDFYKEVVTYLSTLGKFYMNNEEVAYNKKWDRFEYNNPNTFVLVVSDHIWNYDAEKAMNKYDSISRFSRYYCRQKLCMQANCIVINVQQQENAKDSDQFTVKGKAIADKYVPTTKSVANNKEVINDCSVVLGIFAASRYKHAMKTHNGYDLNEVGDRYRALYPLKTREAAQLPDERSLPLLFDGANNYFEELPKSTESGMKRFKEYFKK